MLRTFHVPVTDMEPPTVAQVTEILDLLSGPGAELTYVHCEAGKARTGVAIACYRMAVTGWSTADALTEAINFGCSVPGQQAFIREFGDMLLAARPRPVPATAARIGQRDAGQLSATIGTVADPH